MNDFFRLRNGFKRDSVLFTLLGLYLAFFTFRVPLPNTLENSAIKMGGYGLALVSVFYGARQSDNDRELIDRRIRALTQVDDQIAVQKHLEDGLKYLKNGSER